MGQNLIKYLLNLLSLQDNSRSRKPTIDMEQTTAYCFDHQENSGFHSNSTVYRLDQMVNLGKLHS